MYILQAHPTPLGSLAACRALLQALSWMVLKVCWWVPSSARVKPGSASDAWSPRPSTARAWYPETCGEGRHFFGGGFRVLGVLVVPSWEERFLIQCSLTFFSLEWDACRRPKELWGVSHFLQGSEALAVAALPNKCSGTKVTGEHLSHRWPGVGRSTGARSHGDVRGSWQLLPSICAEQDVVFTLLWSPLTFYLACFGCVQSMPSSVCFGCVQSMPCFFLTRRLRPTHLVSSGWQWDDGLTVLTGRLLIPLHIRVRSYVQTDQPVYASRGGHSKLSIRRPRTAAQRWAGFARVALGLHGTFWDSFGEELSERLKRSSKVSTLRTESIWSPIKPTGQKRSRTTGGRPKTSKTDLQGVGIQGGRLTQLLLSIPGVASPAQRLATSHRSPGWPRRCWTSCSVRARAGAWTSRRGWGGLREEWWCGNCWLESWSGVFRCFWPFVLKYGVFFFPFLRLI